MHTSTISRIFSGSRQCTLRVAGRISQYTGVSLDTLHYDLCGTKTHSRTPVRASRRASRVTGN